MNPDTLNWPIHTMYRVLRNSRIPIFLHRKSNHELYSMAIHSIVLLTITTVKVGLLSYLPIPNYKTDYSSCISKHINVLSLDGYMNLPLPYANRTIPLHV